MFRLIDDDGITIGQLLDFISINKIPKETLIRLATGSINVLEATGAIYDPDDHDFQIG